jgi:gliding motility-associated-like protein
MNHDKEHIDQLLKEQFSQFAPDAPDVWSGVSQAIGSGSASSTAATGIKSVSVVVKIVAAVAVVSTITAIAYFATKPTTENTAPIVEQPITNQLNELPNQTEETITVEEKVSNPPTKSKSSNALTQNSRTQQTPSTDKIAVTPEPIIPTQVEKAVESTQNEVGDKTLLQKPQALPKILDEKQTKETVKNEPTPDEPKADEPAKNIRVIIPNVFTPDNDGLNDEFVVEIDDCTAYAIKIINYKGVIVYESSNLQEHWNGRIKNLGEDCPAGEYVYTVKFSTYNVESQTKIGKINLIR